jgi:arginase
MLAKFLLVPYDSGKYESGMGKGPRRILSKGFKKRLIRSGHYMSNHEVIETNQELLTDIQSAFRLNSILSRTVAETIAKGMFPVILGGNCITSVGALSGIHDSHMWILWLDAHGDYNTPETTISGYLDGMALSIACGKCWKSISTNDPLYHIIPEDQVVLVGARDIDPEEAQTLKAGKIKFITSDTVRSNNYTIPEMNRSLLKKLYIHFDADVIDESIGQANQFAAPKGLLATEIINIFRWSAANFDIQAVAVTAYNPEYDSNGSICKVIREAIAALLDGISARQHLAT